MSEAGRAGDGIPEDEGESEFIGVLGLVTEINVPRGGTLGK